MRRGEEGIEEERRGGNRGGEESINPRLRAFAFIHSRRGEARRGFDRRGEERRGEERRGEERISGGRRCCWTTLSWSAATRTVGR